MEAGTWRLGRRPALDGLRGIAILLVIGGHARWLPLHSGRAGVNLFFALSGFLITALLLDELERTKGISIKAFYARRARRLLPALVAYLAFAAVVAGVVFTLPVLLYVQNWVLIAEGGGPNATGIAWSLSVEEQFYMLWPLVIVAGIRWRRLPWVVAIAGIILAPVLRGLLWDGGRGEWRIYYGSDTRMDVLLLGCLLALLVKRYGAPSWTPWALWPGLAVVAGCCLAPAWWSVLLDPTVVGIGAVAVIVATLTGAGGWLGHPVLRWFGQRSYALYLWHYVFVVAAREGQPLPLVVVHVPVWVAVAFSLVLAEISWRLVESPFLRRGRRPVAPTAELVASP